MAVSYLDFVFVCSSGAHLFCSGNLGPTNYVCVAIKNKVLIYEINRSKQHYERKKVVKTSIHIVHIHIHVHVQ